jgi:hypothetical protein
MRSQAPILGGLLVCALTAQALTAAEKSASSERPRARRAVAALEARVAALEREVKALRELVPGAKPAGEQAAAATEMKIFALQNAVAGEARRVLEQIFSSRRGFNLAADDRTNSLIVVAMPDDMQVIEALVMRLDMPAAQQGAALRSRGALDEVEQQADLLRAKLAQAQADVERRREQLEFARRMASKGFVATVQVEAEEAALRAAEAVLEQARKAVAALMGASETPDAERKTP